jgi:nicotinamidase/pyrazinamidase
MLRERNVDTLVVVGVATEYCVKATVLDGICAGFRVYVIRDAIAEVDKRAGEAALVEMKDAGAMLLTWQEYVEQVHQVQRSGVFEMFKRRA